MSQEWYKGVYLYPYTYSVCADDASAVERVTSKLYSIIRDWPMRL